MVSAGDVQFYMFLALFGSFVILFAALETQSRKQRKYENEFLNHHRNTISTQRTNDFLPLTFPQQETEHLLNLCRQYRSVFANKFFPNTEVPSVQTHYVGFRRQKELHRPVRIQVIRCTEKHAIIEAGDGATGYVLKKYVPHEHMSLGLTIFNIDAKFEYRLEDGPRVTGIQLTDRDEQPRGNQSPAQDVDPGIAADRQTLSYVRFRHEE